MNKLLINSLVLISLIATVCGELLCPNEGDVALAAEPLTSKYAQDICDQGIKTGGPQDVEWVKKNIVAVYLTKGFLGKDVPVSGFINPVQHLKLIYLFRMPRFLSHNATKTA